MNLLLQKDSTTGKWIVKIDATASRTSSCLRKFVLTNCYGLRPEKYAVDMEFGSAFHIFAKNLPLVSSEVDLSKAINPAVEYFKKIPMDVSDKKGYMTAEYLAQVCFNYYLEVWKGDRAEIVKIKDIPLVEKDFAIKYYSTDIADYMICGTIDKIVKFSGGGPLCISDYKTTSKYLKVAVEWFKTFELTNQLLMYLLGLKMIGDKYPDGELGQLINNNRIGCFIDGIFVPSGVRIEFGRSKVFFKSSQDLIEFESSLKEFVLKLDYFLSINKETKQFPYREGTFNGTCNLGFSPCTFSAACASPDESSFESILNNSFTQKEYDPLKFGKET